MMIQRSIIAVLLVTTWCQSLTTATNLNDPTSEVTELVDPAGIIGIVNGGRGVGTLARRTDEGLNGDDYSEPLDLQEGTGIATNSAQSGGALGDLESDLAAALRRRSDGELALPEQTSPHGPFSVSLLSLRRRLLEKLTGQADQESTSSSASLLNLHRRSGLVDGSKLLGGGQDEATQSGSLVSPLGLRRRSDEPLDDDADVDAVLDDDNKDQQDPMDATRYNNNKDQQGPADAEVQLNKRSDYMRRSRSNARTTVHARKVRDIASIKKN